jgi:hypothetical protein
MRQLACKTPSVLNLVLSIDGCPEFSRPEFSPVLNLVRSIDGCPEFIVVLNLVRLLMAVLNLLS